MKMQFLKSKIHRATVTEADLTYEGSISIDPKLISLSGLHVHERVEIYNCNNGERFATYVISGNPGQICLNGAAARLVQKGDIVIIASYCELEALEVASHKPKVVFVDGKNRPKELRAEENNRPAEL